MHEPKILQTERKCRDDIEEIYMNLNRRAIQEAKQKKKKEKHEGKTNRKT